MNNKKPNYILTVICLILLIIFGHTFFTSVAHLKDEVRDPIVIEYSTFIDKVEAGEIITVKFLQKSLLATDSSGIIYHIAYIADPDLTRMLKEHHVIYFADIENSTSSTLSTIFLTLLPIFVFVGLMALMYRHMFGMGRTKSRLNINTSATTKFEDVAGQEEAKEQVQEIISYLKNPNKYRVLGARQPKGALLVGPPGTGKTLLAKAVAGEAGVNFISAQGSDFVEMFVGVGASRIRDLFKQARKNAPCIIFIDEIDSIGRKRSAFGNSTESENTLNSLLGEMDGFDSSSGIVILAATNRPEDLDQALLRPGRFDRQVVVNLPDIHGREDILRLHTKNVPMAEDIDLHKIAVITSGASGADLANMINEAAIEAVRQDSPVVKQQYLLNAVEVVIAGVAKKKQILSDTEKRIVAFHETGHAYVTAKLKNSMPIQKITIIPRTMGALGFVLQSPEEDKMLKTNEEILNEITTLCAGRACEEAFFTTITTGAANDIEKATNLAQLYVTRYGMSSNIGFINLVKNQHKFVNSDNYIDCSEELRAKADKEVNHIIQDCYNKAKDIITNGTDEISKLADFLIVNETITGEEFMELLRKDVYNAEIQDA